MCTCHGITGLIEKTYSSQDSRNAADSCLGPGKGPVPPQEPALAVGCKMNETEGLRDSHRDSRGRIMKAGWALRNSGMRSIWEIRASPLIPSETMKVMRQWSNQVPIHSSLSKMKPCSADTLEPYMTSTKSAHYLTKNKYWPMNIGSNVTQGLSAILTCRESSAGLCLIRKEQQEQVWQHFSLP